MHAPATKSQGARRHSIGRCVGGAELRGGTFGSRRTRRSGAAINGGSVPTYGFGLGEAFVDTVPDAEGAELGTRAASDGSRAAAFAQSALASPVLPSLWRMKPTFSHAAAKVGCNASTLKYSCAAPTGLEPVVSTARLNKASEKFGSMTRVALYSATAFIMFPCLS